VAMMSVTAVPPMMMSASAMPSVMVAVSAMPSVVMAVSVTMPYLDDCIILHRKWRHSDSRGS
jgi:hypothetical protein